MYSTKVFALRYSPMEVSNGYVTVGEVRNDWICTGSKNRVFVIWLVLHGWPLYSIPLSLPRLWGLRWGQPQKPHRGLGKRHAYIGVNHGLCTLHILITPSQAARFEGHQRTCQQMQRAKSNTSQMQIKTTTREKPTKRYGEVFFNGTCYITNCLYLFPGSWQGPDRPERTDET